MKQKLYRLTTISCSFKELLKGQLEYMNNHYDVTAVAADTGTLAEVGEVVALGTRPTGEDFGYYSQRYPSIFYRVGVGRGEEGTAVGALHTATFAPATEAIDHGVVAMAVLALHI